MKEDLRGYPMLQAVDRVLDLAKGVQGISQPMPADLHAALAALAVERERLSFLQRQGYASPDELQRGDWIIIRGALREAATNVRRATGAAQDPSWMQPAIQIADSRSKHRSEQVDSSGDLVIFSEAQMHLGDGAGFWSNVDGWAVLESATRFVAGDRDRLYMPNSLQQDAQIVTLSDAEAKLEAYQEAVDGLEVARPC
ncbi:hypothetical protein LMG667_03405 [Xanthomonas euvesicatoria]|uniref:hypothetical protein n=1 Tax=Xanthomonas euvesicatoria TaxID=456327 RepID=UPI00080EC0CC|nr:hypothetical protein [Xanthomonas euvesicatoria]OCG90031.1 hypothetical protein LMG667_03405 [Xanthomonas euvesicatoria]